MDWRLMRSRLGKLCGGAAIFALAGCNGTGSGPDVSALREVVGPSLAGAQGKTETDQGWIDDAVVGLCATAIYTPAECARHGEASDARHAELGGLL